MAIGAVGDEPSSGVVTKLTISEALVIALALEETQKESK
jgi:hypothetical protein